MGPAIRGVVLDEVPFADVTNVRAASSGENPWANFKDKRPPRPLLAKPTTLSTSVIPGLQPDGNAAPVTPTPDPLGLRDDPFAADIPTGSAGRAVDGANRFKPVQCPRPSELTILGSLRHDDKGHEDEDRYI